MKKLPETEDLLNAYSFDGLVHVLETFSHTQSRVRAARYLHAFGERAVEPLCKALRNDEIPAVRAAAAESLGDIGDARAVEPLIDSLRSVEWQVRAAAAKALGQLKDARAIEPLCNALLDKDFNVRAAAAEALGLIGDERALQPLLEAMRGCFVGRSSHTQLVVGLIVIPFIFIAIFAGASYLGAMGGLGGIMQAFFFYYSNRRRTSKLCGVIAQSLAQIAERAPAPELRAILPDLKVVAADVLQQDRQTRAMSRQVAQKIEALTEQLKNLPLPASAPAPDAATLPRAVDVTTPDVKTLPRVE